MFKLDYSLETPEERNELVKKILEENPNPSEKYLEILADYLVLCMEKQERKNKQILTDNRMTTVNRREISFEGLVSQLENGEDGIYNLINENKNSIFQPKITITQKDLDEVPSLKQLREAINFWDAKLKMTEGKDAFIIKKALIEMRKDQYIMKTAFRKPIASPLSMHSKPKLEMPDKTSSFDEDGRPIPEGITLLDPKVCSAILCNYSHLKEESWDEFDGDTWYLMYDFDNLSSKVLAQYPLYERIVECKIDGMQNQDIQKILLDEFGLGYSLEYISNLWRNKIPKLIASAAEDQYLDEYYLNQEKGKYKKCSQCGQIKLAHTKYFSKNKTSKDGFYSICKACRSARTKKKKG